MINKYYLESKNLWGNWVNYRIVIIEKENYNEDYLYKYLINIWLSRLSSVISASGKSTQEKVLDSLLKTENLIYSYQKEIDVSDWGTLWLIP